MSQSYKFKSLIIANGNEGEPKQKQPSIAVFEVGDTRTIDFLQLDGTRQNFAYSHYITSWLRKEDNQQVIKIFFATHCVTMKGYCLEQLYDALAKLTVTSVKAFDERYVDLIGEDQPYLREIEIVWNKEQKRE